MTVRSEPCVRPALKPGTRTRKRSKGGKSDEKLTCRDLGGPCDAEITGNSFAEMGRNSKTHVMEQIKNGDAAHQSAAGKMRGATPEQQMAWMAGFERKFNEAPEV